MERCMPDIETVADGKRLYVVRQKLRTWNFCALEQNRYEGNIPAESRADLDSHKIKRIVDAALACFVGQIDPAVADSRNEYVATRDLIVQSLMEINPKWNAVHIHKQAIFTELTPQQVCYATSLASAVISPTG